MIRFILNKIKEDVFSRATVVKLIGLLFILLSWQAATWSLGELAIASPYQTIASFLKMLTGDYFIDNFLITLRRLFFGIGIGSLVGFFLGILAGIYDDVKHFLELFIWILMSVPPVVVTVLAMLWFGMGSTMVIFIASLMLIPFVYINVIKGMELIDENLTEMSDIYRYRFLMKLWHLYIPAISAPLLAAMNIVIGNGIRVVVLAELLGALDGIGYAISITRSNLEVAELFAWVLATLLIVAFFQYIILKPMQEYFLRWKN
jgi:NitT/TauT family transport system permease protein